jgi:hypothetical protein
MSHSSRLPFSVARFAIEGTGEGAGQIHPICPAPPRLPSSHIASVPNHVFPINPFSLSRNSFPYLNKCIPSQNSVDICNNVPTSASVSSDLCPQHAPSLFPNPFLIKRTLVPQPAPTTTIVPIAVPFIPTTSSVKPIQNLNSSLIPLTRVTTTPSLALHRKPRNPWPDRILATSIFRPRVMAADRLFSWRTPYGLSHDEMLLAELPPALVESAKLSISGALAISTRSTYAAGILRFNQFCDKWQISEGARMPASYALLCAFIGNYKGLNSGRTIRSWLSGIRAWHLTNHAPWYGDDKWVQMARISANKEGSRHKRPLRAPVSIEHLLALRKAITLTNHFHAAVWAVALVTFFGCRRLGETTVSAASSFTPNLHVLRSAGYVCPVSSFLCSSSACSVSFTDLRDGSRSASFRIPWTKTTREEGASIIITGRNDQLCPCEALRNHLTVNRDVPGSSSLFAYTTADGHWEHMTKYRFMDFCTDVWSKATLAHVLGHSFRIGGAVELLLAGVPPEIVAATGGWTSLAFLLYWRRMEEILPMSTSKAYQRSHVDALAEIFEKFRVDNLIPSNFIASHDRVIEL